MTDDDKTVYVLRAYSDISVPVARAYKLVKETKQNLVVLDEGITQQFRKSSCVAWSYDREAFKREFDRDIRERLDRLRNRMVDIEMCRGTVRVVSHEKPERKPLVLK